MKKFFLFLMLLTFAVGQMWGTDATFSWTSGGTMGSNATGKQGNITLTGAANSASGAPAVTSNTLRLYAHRSSGNGASATFTADDGYQITAITVTSSNGGTILKYSVDGGSYTTFSWSSGSSTISNLTASAITLKNCQNSGKNNTTIQVASVVVTYESTGGGCDKSVILAQSVSNGTATFTPAGPVATCSATASDRQVSVSITPTTGYALTSGPTVSGVTNATISGSGPYTIQLPQNGNGELTLSATCTAIAVTGVSLNKNSTSIVEGSTETLTATIIPSNALDKAVTWYSNAEGVATVSNSGVVTAVAAGNATITVTTHDGSFSASCTVTVTALPKDHFIDEVQGSSVADKTSAYDISTVKIADKTVATSGSCEQQHYHFVGWITKAKYDAGTAISNSDIQTGNKTPNNSTYYAVWAKQGAGGGSSPTEYIMNSSGSLNTNWQDDQDRNNGIQSYAGKSSFQMYGETKTMNPCELTSQIRFTNITGISINVAANNANTVSLYYSADGSSWETWGNTVSVAKNTSSYTDYDFNLTNFPSGSYYICISNSTSSMYMYSVTITSGSAPTYTDYIAKCCTPLVSINGSVSVTNQTVSWSAVKDASGYKVKVGTGDWSDIGNVTSKTFDLPCGGDTYSVYVMAYNNNNPGHCTGDGPASNAIQVTSAACTEPAITVDPNALTGLNYIVNAGPSAAQSFSISGTNLANGSLTITAPTNYEVSKTSATAGFANSVSVNANGTLSATDIWVRLKANRAVGNYNNETVSISGCGLASAVNVTVSGSVLKPTITATPTSISDWSTQTGSAPNPATKTITVTGVNLKADISATLTAGDNYFTITPSGLAQSEGSVNNGSVVIGVKAATYAAAGTYNGTLRLSTTDGDNADVTFSLTVTDDPREKFTLLTSSNVGEIGDGTRIVLVYEVYDIFDDEYQYYAIKNVTGSKGFDAVQNGATEFSINGTTLTLEDNNNVQVLEVGESGDYFTLSTGSAYLQNNGDKSLTTTTTTPIPNAAKWSININENTSVATITSQSTQEQDIRYNTGQAVTAQPFRCYNSSAANTADIKAYFKASTTPKVNISGTLNAFTYMRDQGPSGAQSFKVRGKNLSANLVVEVPTNYEVCTTENGTYGASVEFEPTTGSVAQTDVYIRLKADLSIANNYNGNITVSSTGATNATLAVAGSVTTPIYTVTLNTNGGTIEDGHDVTSYTEGVGATLPTAEYISKSGFSFDGWFDNDGLSGSVVTAIATNATGAKEYWAKWTELPGYDITWLVDGEAYTGGEPDVHVVYNGSISKLPSTPTSLDITSKTFVGWTTAEVNDKQADAPTPLYTAANQIPGNITENKIFYAVFAQEVLSGEFTKVTEASTLAAGDRLLFVNESNSKAAGAFGAGAYLTSQNVTISNSTISSQGDAVVYVLGGSVDAWTFTSGEGTLGCTGTGNASLSTSGGTTTWEITITSGTPTIKPTDLVTYLKYNNSSPRFTTYANSGGVVQLYREGTSLNDYTTKFVKPVAVTGVTLNKNATTLAIGGTETLTATVAPANATNKNVSWSSNATGIATVEAGVVTAVAAGEATITVTTEDGSFTDECVVTVLPTVATPTFSPAAGAINKGSKVEILCATEDATILYSLDGSDPSVAYPEGGVAINANCTLKAKATKANYTTSAVAQAAYTIIKASQTVSFAEIAISFRLGSDEYEAFTGQTASSTYDGASITYASSNTSVAVVDENTGAVTLQGVKGTTTITATAAEDDDYASAFATYTITVLRAGVVRTGDFVLVTNANQLEDGDYILLTSETSSYGSTAEVFSDVTSSGGTHQSKTVANDEITYSQLLAEGNTAKIITLEKVTVGNIDYWAFNYGTESDIYIKGTSSTTSAGLDYATSTDGNYVLWNISIGEGNVANVTNKDNSSRGTLCYNPSGGVGYFKAYASMATNYSLRIYKQKDKNKEPQTLSFVTPSYEFPLNESAYTSFAHQTVSGAQTAVTYTSNNDAVAVINNNTVVLNGGVGTATITATAAEDDDYEHASATYTITVTAALNTVTFHYYKPADATADQTALKEESSGAGITVPANPANVGEYTFLGWAPATLVETQTAPDNLVALQAGATYHPATNKEYHAIYRRLENSDGRFYLMHNNNYAKAPAESTSKTFQNTTNVAEAAIFEITEDNKLFYYEGNTPRYFSSKSTTARDIDFTPNAAEAAAWTIVESGLTSTFYSTTSSKYLMHNGNIWAAYANANNDMSEILTQVYLADVYYSSTPNLMVSPVLTWAQGNATHVMEIEATYDNAATATVGGEPVSVSYSSSDPEKATVSNAGVVTAIKGGLVTITATVAENPGVSRQLVETYQVSITKKVPQITFAAETEPGGYNYKVFVGEAYQKDLSENVTIVSDGAVSYSLSGNVTTSEYAEIDASTGVVKGLASTVSAIQYMYVRTAETDMYQAGQANHIFYVLALKNQPLAFGQNAYVFDMNESVDAFVNTLSGAVTTVAYASDNTSVAEVNASTGEVTVHTNVCGVATITATAAEGQVGNDVYKAVSQTYTITVNYPKPVFSMESSEIKAPVSLSIAGYDDETKLYYTDGNEEPATEYSEPLAISETKTIRAKATNADGSLVSPIASVTLTKVVPTVVGTENKGTITLSADEGALITYIILNPNGITVAEGTDVASPVEFSTELSGTYAVEASVKWDVENGFAGETYNHDFDIKGKGHLPINYTGYGNGLANESWAQTVGNLGNYGSDNDAVTPRIKIAENQALIAAFMEKPVQLSYKIKHNGTWDNANVFKVQWSADGENYFDIVTYTGTNSISTTATNEQFDLDASARYIKWVYVNKSSGNVGIGDINITCEAVVIDGVNVVDIPENYDGDVIVENGVTWEPDGTPEIGNLWIKQGAVVDLTNAILIVNDVVLESQEGYSGQILEPDNFEATGHAYYDLTLNTSGKMDNSKWYAFAVPFQVDAASGIQRLSNDGKTSNAGFNSHYVLLKYNSANYASTGQGWEYVNRGETLMPGKFYMIALNSNEYNRVRMTKKADTPLNNKADLTLATVGTGIHANWNALANNALAYANVSATDGNAGLYVQVYNSATDNYTPLAYSAVTFTVGTPFFVQVVEAGTMSVVTGESNHGTLKAPQREAVATEVFQIRLGENTESYYDILYVSASDEALDDYQIGHDLVKAGVSTTVPQLYVPAYGGKLCKAEFPLANNEATFPLTFTAPSAGTYQLYLAETAADAELYLLKDGATIWNLTMGTYPLELSQGTTENYGLLLKAKAPGSATGIENGGMLNGANGVQKVIIDDHVYILRGGQMYDVTGKAVK